MRFSKVLLKKCFRDIFRNIKQFISIIFIVAISCTLYIGLEANAQGFENRVNTVFKEGNLSDLWVTVNPELDNYTQMDQDLQFIKSVSGEESEAETRLFLPSNILSYSVNGLISSSFPNINKPCSFDSNQFTDNNFFFVDETLIAKYKTLTGKNFTLGDSLPVSLQTEMLRGVVDNVLNNEEAVKSMITSMISSSELNDTLKKIIEDLLKNNISVVQDTLKGIAGEYLKNDTVTYNMKVNGIMSHPENVENGTFSSSNYLLSSRLLLTSLVDDIGSKVKTENILSILNKIKEQYEDNVAVVELLDKLIETINKDSAYIDTVIHLIISDINFSINHKNNQFVEDMLTHFYNQIVVSLDSSIDEETVINQINNYYKLKDNNNLMIVMNRKTNASIAGVINDITQAKQLTFVFPIIFFVVALLIVLTTIAQLIIRERTQIGTMKALGVSNTKIFLYYSSIMTVVGTIGVLLGCLIGPAIIPQVLNIKYSILYTIPSISYVFPGMVSLIVWLLITGLVTLLTYLLIRKELKLCAAESMRVSTPKLNLKPNKKPFKNTSLMMTFRNIKVHFTKSIMVIIGVMGCTGLLICGMGIDDTINYGKDKEIANFLGSDLTISLNSGLDPDVAKTQLLTIEGVKKAEEYTISQGQVSSKKASINSAIYYVSMNSSFFKYDDEMEGGHWDKSKIALTEQKAKKLGVKEGDTITLTLGGKPTLFEIDRIFYAFSANGVFFYREGNEDYNKSPTNVWVDIEEGYDPDTVKAEILEKCPTVYSAMTYQENIDRIDGYMSSVGQMTLTIKIFAILLAVVVLINLAILNFNERKRDIATLRVLGFSRFEIASSLIYEVMILTIIGSLLGMAIGLPLEMLTLGVNQVELIDWKYVIFPMTYLISFLISVVTALVANLIISTRVNKISMSESLKSIE